MRYRDRERVRPTSPPSYPAVNNTILAILLTEIVSGQHRFKIFIVKKKRYLGSKKNMNFIFLKNPLFSSSYFLKQLPHVGFCLKIEWL